jgi:hypothetical protein
MRLLAALALLMTTTVVWAFPTSSNIIPTADMLELDSLRVEFENDGAPRLFGPEAENYVLVQYAPHSRFELGADLYSAGSSNQVLLNAKWLVSPEAARRPALALGGMEFGSGSSPTSYLVATKDVGQGLRLHLGGAASDDSRAVLFGVEQQLSEQDYLLADYASWSAGYATVGVYREVQPGVAVNLAYAWPNARGEPSLTILNISWTHAAW